jgi:hypothetical protein
MHPFDVSRYRIKESSNKLFQYYIWTAVIIAAIVITAAILLVTVIIPLGITLADFDPNNFYSIFETMLNAGAIAALVIIAIEAIILLIIQIMIYVQLYRLGKAFNLLYNSDPISTSSNYASYGIYGYIITIVIGIFVPGYVGTAISIVGYVSLTVGFYFIYQTFIDYNKQGRFNKKPTMLLAIGAGIGLAVSIASIFTLYGSIGSIIGYIFLVLGYRDLAKDIDFVGPPGPGPVPTSVTVEAPTVQPPRAPVKDSEIAFVPKAEISETPQSIFCSNCRAEVAEHTKFCTKCGAKI